MTRAHRKALAGLRDPAQEALSILAAKLPDAPTSVVEARDAFFIQLWVTDTGRHARSASDTTWVLLGGAGTPVCANAADFGTPARQRYEIARIIAAAWLLDEEPPVTVPLGPATQELVSCPSDPALIHPSETLPAYQALRQLPLDEQRSRVATYREAELACDGRDSSTSS